MSTKSKKTVTSSSSTNISMQMPQSTSTPLQGSRPGSSAGGGRPSSPLSPTRQSRLQEKAELQNLNDRLATYIDRVRSLENENSGLRREIQTTQETITREVSSIKGMYEHELQDARKLLDDTSREKAKLEIDLKRLYEELGDIKKKLERKTVDCANAENSAQLYESRATELGAKYNTALSERKKAQAEAQDLSTELNKLNKILADTRKMLEDEMLCRIDMENTVQSLREEICFKDQVFEQELQETRTRRQVELSEIDGRLSKQYEAKLQQSLQELREQQEANVRANREEIEGLYENKLKNLQASSSRNSSAAGIAMEELRTMRMRTEAMNNKLSDLENTNAALNNRIRDLENQLEKERSQHAHDLASLESELARLREEMANQLREYASLMEIKLSLDHEIATYRTLLESEEDRLNITATSQQHVSSMASSRGTPSRRDTPLRASRKRTLVDESEERSLQDFSVTSSAKGDVEIAEACPDGKFVKVHNKGKKEVSIGGFQLVRRAGESETVFKFHRTVKLEPGSSATVWSADIGAEHDPPHSIVMKGQKWFVADNFKTVLINSNQEEVATSERQRRHLSSSAQRHRELAHKYPRREEYMAQGELRDGNEKCRLM